MLNPNEIMIAVTPRSNNQNYIVWHGRAYPVYFDEKPETMEFISGLIDKKWKEESK